jgi:hypothetical protein
VLARARGDASQKSSSFVASFESVFGETAQSSTTSSLSFRCERGVCGATRTTVRGPSVWMSSPQRKVSVPLATMYSSSIASW